MTKERWVETKEKIKDMFPILDEGQATEDIIFTEWVSFRGPEGKKMKLAWSDQPMKIGEKTISSKRIGSSVTIEPEYSETERLQKITLYVWDDALSDWRESEQNAFA